ncbi:MAG: MurR/RpiR family transcriptional regulator [Oscillospiraceae bacterium]|nr:MurR/RpiR family transcriptional regulator [Oscillospiraceae bacterium]
MQENILSIIQEKLPFCSKGQKRIGAYILDHYDKAAFMTAGKLGTTVQVSESTVVRFATCMGYDGYPGMQAALQDIVRTRLTSVQRLEVANNQLADQDVVSMVLQSDINALRMTNEALSRDQLNAAVDALIRARSVYIIGVRSSSNIASFLNFYLRTMLDDVRFVHSSASTEMLEQMRHLDERDICIGISLPRYSGRTVKLMHYAKDRGCSLVAITDSHQAPVARLSDYVLIAKSDMLSLVDSLVAPLSVVNALVVAVSQRLGKELSQSMLDLERIWAEYAEYGGYEANGF